MDEKKELENKATQKNEDIGKQTDSKSSCGCGDEDKNRDHAKALQEQSKIECHGDQPAGKKVEEKPETPAVKAEKARVKDSQVLEGPKKTPTERPADQNAN